MEVSMVRVKSGLILHPDNEPEDAEAFTKIPLGAIVSAEIKQKRNYMFLRKFFALCRVAFDYWEETMPGGQEYKGEKVKPEFERFRKDLIILSGFYDPVFAIDGSVKLKAKSISFGRMNEEEFDRVYNKVLDTVLAKITRNWTKAELQSAVDQIIGFM